MIRPVLALAAVGFVGILLLPFIFVLLKVALIGGLILLAFWWFNRKDRGKEDTPPATE